MATERCEICTRRFATHHVTLQGVTRVIPVCDRKRCKETATAEILYAEKQEAEQIVVAFTRGQAEYLLQILPTNCTARVIRDQIEQTIAKAEEDAENGHAQD